MHHISCETGSHCLARYGYGAVIVDVLCPLDEVLPEGTGPAYIIMVRSDGHPIIFISTWHLFEAPP